MKVLWTTRDSGFPEVRWGSSPGKYSHIAGGVSTTYTRQGVCGSGGVCLGGGGSGIFALIVR